MSQHNVAIVRSGYEAFRRGDLRAVFAALDPDVEFRDGKVIRFEAYIDHPRMLAALQP